MDPKRYFQNNDGHFWQWEENGQVVAIPNGGTIAYRKFIVEVLEMMEPQGFPPFGALLLAIVATNPKGREEIKLVNDFLQTDMGRPTSELLKTNDLLIALTDLPEEYKRGKNRMILLQRLFQNCHNRLGKDYARNILSKLQKEWEEKDYGKRRFDAGLIKRELKTLSLIHDVLPSTEAILNRISGLPKTTDVELILEPESGKEPATTDFIEELIEHDHTFHVGTLVKQIWSGLQIPFHNNVPSEQPLGGIADVTNKGDFDKLLLSEFANDDVVLMSRLANNEALYFHREIPPTDNNFKRVILIDASLKNWGTIKTIAFASLLAITKHPKNDIECLAFVVGDSYHPIRFDTVHDVIKGQRILEPSLDASIGLEQFFKENNLTNNEVFLVTAQETLRHTAMYKLMAEYAQQIDYWIHPTAEGEISLFKKQKNGKKIVQKIKITLKELWSRKRKPKLSRETINFEFPLLFPNPMNPRHFITSGTSTFYKITREKALLRWQGGTLKDGYKIGWELVRHRLPSGGENFAAGRNIDGDEILLTYNRQKSQIILLNLVDNSMITKDVSKPSWSAFPNYFFYDGVFHFLTSTKHWRIDLSGEVIIQEGRDEYFEKLYKEKEKFVNEARLRLSMNNQILKNIKEVFINDKGFLIFNIHKLHCNQGNVLKLDPLRDLVQKTVANNIGEGQFVFEDGSTISVNRGGMITLQSSDPDIPTIYVTSVLEKSLGAATKDHFTGSEYFMKKSRFDVEFKDSIREKLSTIKIIRKVLGVSLKDVKAMVDAAPGSLVKNITKQTALELKKELDEINVKIHLRPIGAELKKMSPPIFYYHTIRKFIEHIHKHES